MRIHSVFGFIFLVIVALNIMPTATESSSLGIRIYLDPANCIFDSTTVSTGYKFNITLRVDEVVDLVAWQVKMYYNDSIINITRWFEPTWDSQYVFYGKTTFGAPIQPDCAYEHVGPSNGSTQVGALLLPLPPNQTAFSGSGKLCILEFTVTAIPSEDETLSCLLSINNPLTFLLETDGSIIPNVTKEDGYYELSSPEALMLKDINQYVITASTDGVYFVQSGEPHDAAGTAYLYGACDSRQVIRMKTDSTLVNQSTGRPHGVPSGKSIVLFGGTAAHTVTCYYEDNLQTPLFVVQNLTHWMFKKTSGNTIAAQISKIEVASRHHDLFIIEVLRDPDRNYFVAIFYGIIAEGTLAAGLYFKDVILPNINDYEFAWYVFRWDDGTNGQPFDGFPQSQEVTQVNQGNP